MKIVVLAHPKDDHAAPVQWALQQAGYQTFCWSGVSWTEAEQASMLVDESLSISLGAHRLEQGDVLWLRQSDHQASDHQAEPEEDGPPSPSFFDELGHMFEKLPVRCVNPYSALRLVRNKAVQLLLARKSGLKVPETVISNSPTAVREFFDRHPSDAICKAFATHVWQQQGSTDISVTETFCLNREELPADDEIFTYAPAIYQEKVRKQFDVRAVLMGDRVYSFALRTPANSLDWRHDAALRKVTVEEVATPPAVERGILSFARQTGVCFGSLDLAVDQNGEWWFLEINEQGQFLWLDDLCPEARLLEKFCAFLTARQGATHRLEDRQGLFPSTAEYERLHPARETPTIAEVSADAAFKSME
jgi:glutathione synthase/RimK-type ligase-like ATP-grasp enzyme